MINFRLDIKIPEIDPQAIRKVNLQKICEEEMLATKRRIQADALAGRTADGGGMKGYSDAYKKQIDSGRLYGKTPGDHTPNLHAQRVLLYAGMAVEKLANGARMLFTGNHPPTKYVKSGTAKTKRQKTGFNRLKPAARLSKAEKLAVGHRSNVKSAGGSGGKRSSGSGKASGSRESLTNAEIAARQYELGRSGWFCFSRADIDRITARVRMAFAEAIDNAIRPGS